MKKTKYLAFLCAVICLITALSVSASAAGSVTDQMAANSAAWHIANAAGDKAACEALHAANVALANSAASGGGSASYNSSSGTWNITTSSGSTISSSGSSNGKTSSISYTTTTSSGSISSSTDSSYTDSSIGAYKNAGGTNSGLQTAYNNDAQKVSSTGAYGNEVAVSTAASEAAVAKALLGLTDSQAQQLQKDLEASKNTYVTAKAEYKQVGKSTGKATAKSTQTAIKNTERSVKTAEQTSKMTIKTAQATAKASQQAAVASAKAARSAAAAAKAAAKAAAEAAKVAAKATASAVKAIAAAVKALVAAIAAGGWVAVLVIVIVVLIVAVIASPFGIFFSGESADSESVPASAAIAQINYDFNSRLAAMQDGDYDDIVLEGAQADWVDILAVFAVKVAGAEDASATYVASLDAERVEKLKAVFYEMTSLSSYVETINYSDSDPDDDRGSPFTD